MTPFAPGALPAADALALDRDGCRLLRGLVAGAALEALRAAFDAGVLASDRWPVPRGPDWRHAQLDLDPQVQALCRAPPLLAAAWRIIGAPFFLAQVEGREPCAGGGAQLLHRDSERPGVAAALVYLDRFGPWNGATRVAPALDAPLAETPGAASVLSGEAGDVLVLDARLPHGATLNASGERRRSLLMSYVEAAQLDDYRRTAALRGVRMAAGEVFAPG